MKVEETPPPRSRPPTEEVEAVQILSEEPAHDEPKQPSAEPGEAPTAPERRRAPPPPPRRRGEKPAARRRTEEVAVGQIVSERPVTVPAVPTIPGSKRGAK